MYDKVTIKEIIGDGSYKPGIELCSVVSDKGVKRLTAHINLENSTVYYEIYSGLNLISREISLEKAVNLYNEVHQSEKSRGKE